MNFDFGQRVDQAGTLNEIAPLPTRLKWRSNPFELAPLLPVECPSGSMVPIVGLWEPHGGRDTHQLFLQIAMQ